MKTNKIILTILAFLALSTFSYAGTEKDPSTNQKFDAKVQLTHEDVVILRCVNTKYSNLLVQFYDEEGVLLNQKEVCETCNFKLTYIIEELPHGEYLIKILSKNKAVYTQAFEKKYGKYFLL